INKKFIIKETMISMLFYSAIITAIISSPFAMHGWVNPSLTSLMLLALLGCGANLILFFILKAFEVVDGTACAPYRYFEYIISAVVAYQVFGEIPSRLAIYSLVIIIPSTLFVVYSETKTKNT
ncbi:MAG TPA: EamA family transporter, partial [Candidatus Megaira endosymbiont of Hartmannula sinica]|nr:EamA family transporter [Candidatus Megaera endosymbiont of Hartmannula sinica]